jgi:hypothetical protein
MSKGCSMFCIRLFFSVLALSSMVVINCHAMDLPAQINPLKEGMLTSVSGIITRVKYVGWIGYKKEITKRPMQDTLVQLMMYEKNLDPAAKGVGSYEMFYPLVFKVDGQFTKNLGLFNKQEHRELKEAIRQNKALYYAYGIGALVYSIDSQPSQSICSGLNRELDAAEAKLLSS